MKNALNNPHETVMIVEKIEALLFSIKFIIVVRYL